MRVKALTELSKQVDIDLLHPDRTPYSKVKTITMHCSCRAARRSLIWRLIKLPDTRALRCSAEYTESVVYILSQVNMLAIFTD